MNIKQIYTLLLPLFLFSACSELADIASQVECDQVTIIDRDLFKNEVSTSVTIDSLEINKDCLKITFSSSGCDGNTWQFDLIDSEEILEFAPARRKLRLILDDREACDAWITKVVTFDISVLQLPDGSKVELFLVNNEEAVIYEY